MKKLTEEWLKAAKDGRFYPKNLVWFNQRSSDLISVLICFEQFNDSTIQRA
jgi:hypothetical protein